MRTLCLQVLTIFAVVTAARAQNAILQPFASNAIAETLDGAIDITSGDVNRDGKQDMVVATEGALVLLLGSGAGQFETGRRLLTGEDWNVVVLADFDADGKLDVAAYSAEQKHILVLRGAGDGTFLAPVHLSTLKAPAYHVVSGGMVAADLNQDGILDLTAVQDTGLCVFTGNGNGTFQPCAQVTTDSNPRTVVAADFNRDGFVDLATTNSVAPTLSVLMGLGKGVFQLPSKIAVSSYAMGIAASDLDKDGNTDLAVATQDAITILLGNGNGTFRNGSTMPQSQEPMSIAAGDLNGDGFPDLAFGNYYGGQIGVLLGYGNGSFRLSTILYAMGDVFAVALADMNGDSKPDLLAASHSSGTALLALGIGDGRFSWPAYFGDPSFSFFRTADVDNDSKTDLLAAVPLRKSIFLLHRGSTPIAFPGVSDYPFDAQFGDFNGDKITDVVAATVHILSGTPGDDFGCALHFFPGQSGGGFGPVVSTSIERCPVADIDSAPVALATGDFNADGVRDIAVANNALGAIQLYRGRGDGSFQAAAEVPENSLAALAAADFDRDGTQDIAVIHNPSQASSSSVVVYNGSAAGWKRGPVLNGCATPSAIVAADFNGDSRPDLAVGCGSGYLGQSQLVAFLNAGAGTFRAGQTMPLGFSAPPLLAAADFDGEHGQDLIALERWGRESYSMASFGVLLLSSADGTLRTAGVLTGLPGPAAVAAASWDDDALADLAVLGGRTGAVDLMLNHVGTGAAGQVVPVSAASMFAGPLAPDSIATGFGQGLGDRIEFAGAQTLPTSLAGISVTIMDFLGQSRPARLFYASPAQVNFIVPAATASGTAVISVTRDSKVVAQALTQIFPFAPGIFTANSDGRGVPAAQALHVKANGEQVSQPVFRCGSAPGSCVPEPINIDAAEQVYLMLYATGVRRCTSVTVRVGDMDARVTAAQEQGQYPGLDQVNVLLPPQLAGRGDVDVTVQACGVIANVVRINIR